MPIKLDNPLRQIKKQEKLTREKENFNNDNKKEARNRLWRKKAAHQDR